jgi:hypothetical protein
MRILRLKPVSKDSIITSLLSSWPTGAIDKMPEAKQLIPGFLLMMRTTSIPDRGAPGQLTKSDGNLFAGEAT